MMPRFQVRLAGALTLMLFTFCAAAFGQYPPPSYQPYPSTDAPAIGAGYQPAPPMAPQSPPMNLPTPGPVPGSPAPGSMPPPTEMPDLTPTTETVAPGPSIYSVNYWLTPTLWEGSVELGINGTEGNAQSFSIRTGGDLTRKTKTGKTAVDLTYAKTSSNSIETQHNAIFNGQHDWLFGESPWSVFVRTGLIYDEFRVFDLRFALNAGFGYLVYKDKVTEFSTRFGSGVSREFGGPDDAWVPEAVFGADYTRQISKRQKLNAKIDYFPDWSDFMDYRVVGEVSWEVMLDDDPNLSLKFGIIDRYDSTPNGLKPNNIDYTALLLWKL